MTGARLRGFSLLELLIVLAVVAALVAMVAQVYGSTAQSAAITAGAQLIGDTLSEARSAATAQNTPVEVRIYAVAQSGPPTTPFRNYNAIQLRWVKPDRSTPAMSPLVTLPTWVVIDATTAHSPLIAANTKTPPPDASDPNLNGDTRVFHFYTDGSTDLAPGANWFLTVRAATQSDPAHFPANWACVVIDPVTGRAQVYRP